MPRSVSLVGNKVSKLGIAYLRQIIIYQAVGLFVAFVVRPDWPLNFMSGSVNIFSLVTVTYAKQIWDEMICPKDTKEEESLQTSCDCNRGEEQELMRPDFRRGELNEGQVEMKVDDDAHSIVPESTSAYVQKNSVTTSGPSDILLQQLLRLVTVQGCLLALCTLRRYSSSPDDRHDAD